MLSTPASPPAHARARAIRVLLVDDHELVRMGFRLLLESVPDIEVVGEASSGEDALAQLRGLGGDGAAGPGAPGAASPPGEAEAMPVVLMDMSMPGISGIEATRQLLARLPGLRVLALSAHEGPSHVRHLMRAGGLGYLSKRAAPQTLVEAVRCVARGQRYLDPALAQAVALDGLRAVPPATPPASAGEAAPARQAPLAAAARPVAIAALSEREFEVFLHLARGASVAEIAQQLHISPRTVGTHLYHVKQKTGARNQAEIALLAIQNGLLEV